MDVLRFFLWYTNHPHNSFRSARQPWINKCMQTGHDTVPIHHLFWSRSHKFLTVSTLFPEFVLVRDGTPFSPAYSRGPITSVCSEPRHGNDADTFYKQIPLEVKVLTHLLKKIKNSYFIIYLTIKSAGSFIK